MRKALVLLALPVAFGLAAPAAAQEVPSSGHGAVISRDGLCGMPVDDSGFLVTDEIQEVDTPSGNTVLKCFFTVPDNLIPDEVIRSQGFACGTFVGLTYDSFSIVTPGGQAELTCQIKHR